MNGTYATSNDKDEKMEHSGGAIKTRYDKLSMEREFYLDRARKNAELTIPALMPPLGSNYSTQLPTPFQSVGARGLNNLASKMLLAFLPPNISFFKYEVSETVIKEASQDPEAKLTIGEVEKVLASQSRDILKEINQSNTRVSLFEGFKHVFAVGNVLVNFPEKTNNIKLYKLDRYVVVRDSDGNILELIIKEDLSPISMPKDIKYLCMIDDDDTSNENTDKDISIYTRIEYEEESDMYEITQECNGVIIPQSKGSYPKDKLPYVALRGIAVDGENYGRSYIEEYYGDLKSLEELYKILIQGNAAAAKMLWMVNPNGTTKKQDIARAPNNAVITGNAADVTVIRSDKQADFSIASNLVRQIEDRLGYAFLLNTSIQRTGERVTAEEIRFMAKELEDSLGGMFTTLTQELMIPLLNNILNRLTKQGKIPKIPNNTAKPVLTVGLEAIGRNEELNKLQMFVQSLASLQANSMLNMDEVVKRIGNALNVDMEGLIKSKEEIMQEQQQAQQMAMMQSLGPNAINQLGGMAKEQIAQGQVPEEGM